MKKPSSPNTGNSGLMLVFSYAALFTVNVAVIYLGSLFFPRQIVLGTRHISPVWALLHSMGALALLNTFAIPFIHALESRRHQPLSPREWMVKYLILNFVGIWIIARFANDMGLGISSWVVALLLAVILDFVQGIVMMSLEKAH